MESNLLGQTYAFFQQLLTNLLTDEVRYQDKATVFSSALSNNPENVDLVYEFLTINYNTWAAK
jgi:hypothetical protein